MKPLSTSFTILKRLALPVALLLFTVQCNKDVDALTDLEPYAKTRLDATAGSWKTYVVQDVQALSVPAPADATSAAFQAELQEVKGLSSQLTSDQRRAIRYWGAGAVIRWHEIARELAAEYNVPPNYNADGTYPAPDQNNPGVYPRFPFANPPYTARALALLAVAQYDALVAAWNYKFKYNRKAPAAYDNSIQTALPGSDLPAYPSEDAVVAAASREILKFLFPNEKAAIDAQAREHIDSRLWAGTNVRSDLDAGTALGVAVANAVIAYAKADGMKDANNQAAYPNLQADATARGYASLWNSQDKPVRPPMLPFFGNLKTWNMTRDQLVAVRPPVPPQPGSAEFETALKELRDISKNRTREQFRIASYWADGVGTYTPPGHWDRTACEMIYEYRLNEIRAARAIALVQTAVQDAGIGCWEAKYYYLLPRPSEVDSDIKTSTGIPNFPAYTSGHSSFSAAGATVLSYLFPDHAAQFEARANEASESRIYGCIHYRFDCEAGLVCGRRIAEYAIIRGKNDGAE